MFYYNKILLFLGLALAIGLIGGYVFKKIKLSATTGYLCAGLLLGMTGFQMIDKDIISHIGGFITVIVGLLGFMAGTTLRYNVMRRHGRGLPLMMICGGLISFLLTGSVMYWLLSKIVAHSEAVSMACVFGALSSSIGPWTTRDSVISSKARGTVSTALGSIAELGFLPLMAMYCLAVAIVLFFDYGLTMKFAGQVLLKLGGAGLLGVFFAVIFLPTLRFIRSSVKAAAMMLAFVMITAAFTACAEMDVVVATFVLGMIVANFSPRSVDPQAIKLIGDWHLPFYVIFLVIIMGWINVFALEAFDWLLILAYILVACAAKAAGVWLGGIFFEKSRRIRKYLSFGFFSQSAFAIVLALSMLLYCGLELKEKVVHLMVLTTFILQIIGPLCTRLALKLAGESGRNLSDEDLMAEMTVKDVVNHRCEVIDEKEPVKRILERFAGDENQLYPVVAQNNELVGVLNFDSLRGILTDHDSWQWLVAADLVTPASARVTVNDSLLEAYHKLQQLKIQQVPVMDDENNFKLVGMLDLNTIRMKVRSELLLRNHHKRVTT